MLQEQWLGTCKRYRLSAIVSFCEDDCFHVPSPDLSFRVSRDLHEPIQ